MLSLLLLALQAAPPPPPPGSVVAPVPILRPYAVPIMRTEWLSRDDFPAAQADAASPAFAARLDVTADGAVDGCTITKASGDDAFDRRACEVLTKRARFRPALDPSGAPIASGYTFRLPWAAVTPAMPVGGSGWITTDDYPTKALREERTGRTAVLVLVEANGRASDCLVTTSSGHADLDEAACRVVARRGRYRPAVDAAGEPVAGTAPFAVNWRIPDD